MRYIDVGVEYIPKHCKYGPRPAEGIVFNDYEWWGITDHLLVDQREKELVAVQREKEEAKKKISNGMTRNWSNTLSSIKNLDNKRRLEQILKEKQDKIDEYNQILKNREEEQKGIMANVRKILFEEKDAAKTIKSAIHYSLVCKEREEQIALKNSIKAKQALKGFEYAKRFKEEAEELAKEKLQEIIDKKNNQKRYKKLLDEQMVYIYERQKAEAEEFEKQKEDLKNMRVEEERIAKCNEIEKRNRREYDIRFRQKTQNQIDFEKRLQLEEEEEEEINKIYIKYQEKFKAVRKEKEAEIELKKIERRNKITEGLAKTLEENKKREEARLLGAAEEKEKEAKMEEENKERLRREMFEDAVRSKKQAEEKRDREKYELKEKKKWELMQIYRSAEVDDEWRKYLAEAIKQRKAKVKIGYEEQIKENAERRAQELKEWNTPLEDETMENEMLRAYCKEALDFSKENDLPLYPTLKAIEEVKKLNGIWEAEVAEQKKEAAELGKEQRKHMQAPTGNLCYCLKY